MSEELLKIADGLLAVSEGVRALAGKAYSCNCDKKREEERGLKNEESGNEKSQEKQEDAVTMNRSVRSWQPNRRMEKRSRSKH